MKIGFIGAGKVGFSLGKFFSERGLQVTGYYSQHVESAREASEFTGTKCYSSLRELIEESSYVFLTVPDGRILEVYEQCKEYDIKEVVFIHCSGALSIENVLSIHPLFPISDKLNSYRELTGAFFCLEGDMSNIKISNSLEWWKSFLEKNAAGVKVISPGDKVKYHAACVVASNLYVGLMYESVKLLSECGFSNEAAINALTPLVRSNLEHILCDGPVKALTGPVERGDFTTVDKHMKCFNLDKEKAMYGSVTEILKDVAKEKHKGDKAYGKTDS